MKRTFTLLITLFSLFQLADAQVVVWSENFESYRPDTLLEPQSTSWDGWYNAQTNSLVSTDTFAGGKQSAKVWEGAFPQALGVSDVVGLPGSFTSGRYELKFKQFIPSKAANGRAAAAYFNLQHDYNAAANTAQWAIEVYCQKPGAGNRGELIVGGPSYFYPLVYDQWADYRFIIDMDQDSAEMYYNSTLVHKWQWTLQSNSTAMGANKFNAIDLYAACRDTTGCTPLAYYDDFVLTRLPTPPALSAFNLLDPADAGRVNIDGAPTNMLRFLWDKTNSRQGGTVLYNVLMDSPLGDFTSPLLTLRADRSGRDTFLTFSYGQLANILASQLGVPPGDSVTIKWTVQAFAGTDTLLAIPPRTVTLIRGTITGFEQKSISQLELYPNPGKSSFNLNVRSSRSSTDFVLRDLSGRVLRNFKFSNGSHNLNLDFVENGTYILEYSDGLETGRLKLIIQK